MPKKKVIPPFEPIEAGQYFVVERGNGMVDEFYRATSDFQRTDVGKYLGNSSHVMSVERPVTDKTFVGKWTFKDGGKLRPATRRELYRLMLGLARQSQMLAEYLSSN